MKKSRKIFQRAAALLCCIFLLPSLVAVPALAAEDMNIFFDVMNAAFLGSFYHLEPDDNEILIDFGDLRVVRYVDFVFTRAGVAPSKIFFKSNYDGSEHRLNVISLGNMMYRAYGEVSVHSHTSFSLVFETTGTTYIYPYSCDVSFNISRGFAETASMWVNDSFSTTDVMPMADSSTPLTHYLYNAENIYVVRDYRTLIYLDNWRKYDYIDVYLTVNCADITSLSCYIGDVYVPFQASFIDGSEMLSFDYIGGSGYDDSHLYPVSIDSYNFVFLRLDLSEVYRSNTDSCYVDISGQFTTDGGSYVSLRSVTGYLSADESELDTFWIKIKNFFTDLFGKDDPGAAEAQQMQEQINYEMNLQIVGAMEEWDSNITAVQTGYDNAFSYVNPALAWLGGLAQSIFDNMSWFNTIYLLVGLVSVFMLILSKSGIASKIGSAVRRRE